MMIKRVSIVTRLAIGFAALLAAGGAGAQQLAVGVVSFNRLGIEAPQAVAVREALQEEFAPRQREIVALQTELKEKQEQIQRDLDVMGPEERRSAENELRRDERELGRQQQEFTEDVNLRQNEALRKLQGEFLREVQAFAADSGYDLILAEGVVYASPAMDVTERVLERLKASFDAQQSGG
jgi:outer membrane protein